MPKQIICCLCLKRCKQAARRHVVNSGLKNYLGKCFLREVDNNEIICNACYAKYRRQSSTTVRHVDEELPQANLLSPKTIQLKIPSTPRSHKYCIVCKKTGNQRNHLVNIPDHARTQAFIEKGVFIDSRNRCCLKHIEKTYFSKSALSIISVTKQCDIFSRTDIVSLLENIRHMIKKQSHINFNIPSMMTDDDCCCLTGLTKEQFVDLTSYLQPLRATAVRSLPTCLGVFLTQLKTGLPNKILAVLFSLKRHQVQRIIHSTLSAMMTNFVPENIGFKHVTHDNSCRLHTTPIARTLFSSSSDQAVIVLDGTYVYIQKSGHYNFQRCSFSMHKHRPLVKPMVIIGTDGYILSILGPYYADGKNNDASITKHAFTHNLENINEWIQENNVCIVDRGFRDAVVFLNLEQGLDVKMPSYLPKGQKQHTTAEANSSRLITKARWVVESVNVRLKHFKYLDKVVPNTMIPYTGEFLQVIGAICNKYGKPLVSSDSQSENIASYMLEKAEEGNHLQKYLEDNDLLKKKSLFKNLDDATVELQNFPKLNMDQLRDITIGVYQLKQASSYSREHVDDNGEYAVMVCKESPTLIKVKIQSRHTSSAAHTLWIEYGDGHSP
ncbi:uncharacterized protein LOC121374814 [Gigantopelta aegis]|uniref:uncharacterized protein LOC121374814 n=1 Tax=Gigantopelta aegis TaxID=1735272 RepID=UPI001B888C84|nr:uncharacterized protein LOC121374814 [Gigantopelta aegis]